MIFLYYKIHLLIFIWLIDYGFLDLWNKKDDLNKNKDSLAFFKKTNKMIYQKINILGVKIYDKTSLKIDLLITRYD